MRHCISSWCYGDTRGWYRLSETHIEYGNSFADCTDTTSHGAESTTLYIPQCHLLLRFPLKNPAERGAWQPCSILFPVQGTGVTYITQMFPFFGSLWCMLGHVPQMPCSAGCHFKLACASTQSYAFLTRKCQWFQQTEPGNQESSPCPDVKPDKRVRIGSTCHHVNIIQRDSL